LIISGMMGNYDRKKIFPAAAAIETLHTATLIHDDIIDNAKTRRGQPTISEKNGINLAVYTGDYLLANSILLLSEAGLSAERLEHLAKAAKMICVGEVNQYLNRYKLSSIGGYLRRVMKKTGILFSASCALGAHLADCSDNLVNTMGRFGMNLGVAFQIRDDIIDIEGDEVKEGKPVVNDIREGIATLPFLVAARRADKVRMLIEGFFSGIGEAKDLLLEVVRAGGVDDALRLKNRYIGKCRSFFSIIPSSDSINALEEVLNWL